MEKKLPIDWQIKKLGEVCKITYGKGLSTKELKDSGFPVFGANGVIGFNDKYLYKESQVLISCRGAYSGKINISPPLCYVTNNSLILEIFNEEEMNKKFLFYILHTVNKTKLVTGTAQPQVTINNAVELTFSIPKIETQTLIVSKIEELFSELDKGIEDLKTAQQQLKTYRQSVLKWAFEGKKRILFDNIIESSQNGLSKRSGLDGDEFNVLRLADIKNNCIIVDNPRKIKMTSSEILKYKLNEKDLVCIRVNGSKDLVGKIVYVTKNDTNNKWAFCDHFIRFTIKENFDSKFFYHYFQSMEVRKFIHDNMVTSAGQNTVSQVTIKNVLVPNCNFEEQHRIVQEIESRLSVADKMEESIAQSLQQAEALRQSILKKAFSGELV
jgi:type I restriction enzyme S subunit